MKKEWNNPVRERIQFWIAFTGAFFLQVWQIGHSSLWFDETIEYYVCQSDWQTMHRAILGTFQPPLYNYIMYFWLQLSDSVVWFRMFSAFCGMGAFTAVYFCVKHLSGSKNCGTLAMFVYASLYQVVFYNQEAAEYAPLVCFLWWFLYFALQVFERVTVKNALFLVLFCVLAVYSQYGAAITVVAVFLCLYGKILLQKRWKEARLLTLVCGGAGAVAGIPLLVFFLKFQIEAQKGWAAVSVPGFEGIVHEIFLFAKSLVKVNGFLWFGGQGKAGLVGGALMLLLMLLLGGVALWKKKLGELEVILCGVTYLIYYMLTRTGIYGYNSYSTRYTLAILPVFFLFVVMGLFSCVNIMKAYVAEKYEKVLLAGELVVLAGFLLFQYVFLLPNWNKEYHREATECWLAQCETDVPTYVYYGSAPGFSCYTQKKLSLDQEAMERYVMEFMEMDYNRVNCQYAEDNIVFGQVFWGWNTGIFEKEEIQASLDLAAKSWGGWPEKFYIVADHKLDDLALLKEYAQSLGYESTMLYQEKRAEVVRMERKLVR